LQGVCRDGWDDDGFAALEDCGGGRGLGVSCEARICWGLLAREQGMGIVRRDPTALFGDAYGDYVVLLAVDGLEDGGGGEEGDFVLAGTAAEEDAYAWFFLHVWVQVSTTFRVFVCKKV
jgi:hypothetical protein